MKDSLEINDKTLVWWIGLTDREKEGNWKWETSRNIATFFWWGPNEPDGGGRGNLPDQDCVDLWSHNDYAWSDQACENFLNAHIVPICQFDI